MSKVTKQDVFYPKKKSFVVLKKTIQRVTAQAYLPLQRQTIRTLFFFPPKDYKNRERLFHKSFLKMCLAEKKDANFERRVSLICTPFQNVSWARAYGRARRS